MDNYFSRDPLALAKNIDSYLKLKPPDCSLFSGDNYEVPFHKELFYQTKFMQEIVKSLDCCCCKIEIMCPSLTKQDLEIMVQFLYSGKISHFNQNCMPAIIGILTDILGFPIILKNNEIQTDYEALDEQSLKDNKENIKEEIIPSPICENDLTFDETVGTIPMPLDENELENDTKDFFKPEDWKGKSKGSAVYDDEGNKKYECLKCKAEFKQKQRLDNHIAAIHEGNKPFVCYEREGKKKFQCLACKSEFSEKGSLDNHISAVHEGLKPYKCSLCDYAASKKTTLNLHLAAVHEGKRPYTCKICYSSYKTKQTLTNHIASVHEGKKPFHCTSCDRSFAEKRNLKRHNCKDLSENLSDDIINNKLKRRKKQVVKFKKHFECIICKAEFKGKREQKRHMIEVHEGEKPFLCSFCGYSNASENLLKKHIELVHEGKRPYTCHICGNSYKANRDLALHIASVHEGAKPFKCDLCDRKFVSKKHLKMHADVHGNERPHKCNICDAKFKRRHHLVTHFKLLHGQKVSWSEKEITS